MFYSKFIKNVITRLFKKSANRLPTSGMSRYALMDGTYWSQTACIFAMAFGVAPMPKPQKYGCIVVAPHDVELDNIREYDYEKHLCCKQYEERESE